MTYDTVGGAPGTIGRQLLQGATLGFSDEIVDYPTAAIVALLTGQDVGDVVAQARDITRDELARDWKNAPVTSFASQAIGSLPLAYSKPAQALSAWSRGNSILGSMLKGGAVGAGYGAVTGFGGATPEGKASLGDALMERLGSAGTGTAIGGVIGAATSPLARLLTPDNGVDYSKVSDRVASQQQSNADKYIAEQLAARPDLPDMLKRAEAMNAASKATGIDLTLAEKLAQSPSDDLLAQQGQLVRNPQTAGSMEALYAARNGTLNHPGQIESSLLRQVDDLSPGISSYDDAAANIIKQAERSRESATAALREKAAPLYEQAYSANKSVETPGIRRILDTPMGQAAFDRARTTLQNNRTLLGVADKELTEQAADAGIKTGKGVASGLKLEFLDQVKRELDAMYQMAARQGDTTAMRSAAELSRGLLGELDAADATGAYKQARAIYSENPDILQLREYIGNLADVDPMKAKQVAQGLFGGTQQNAEMTAKALGPQGSKVAVSARILDAMDTARGEPTTLAGRIAPDARTADMIRTYAGGNQLDETLNVINQAKLGERFRYGSPTQQNMAAEQKLSDAASGAIDAAMGNKVGLIKKIAGMLGKSDNDQSFYKDMFDLMTTEKGMDLVRRVAAGQGTAIDSMAAKNALLQSINPTVNALPAAASIPAISGFSAPSVVNDVATGNYPPLPPGYVIQGNIPPPPPGFSINK